MEPVSVAFLLYPGLTQLDLTGPAQVLSRLGEQTLHFVAKSPEPVPTDAGFSILPTATFRDLPGADILCVPGGLSCVDAMEDEETLAWVRSVGAEAKLGDQRLHRLPDPRRRRPAARLPRRLPLGVARAPPAVRAEPAAERVVFDRNRVTGGGVTAGIDFALALTAAVRGEQHARAVQLGLEYDPAPPFDSGSPEAAGEALAAAIRRRSDRLAPDRAARLHAAAARHTAE